MEKETKTCNICGKELFSDGTRPHDYSANVETTPEKEIKLCPICHEPLHNEEMGDGMYTGRLVCTNMGKCSIADQCLEPEVWEAIADGVVAKFATEHLGELIRYITSAIAEMDIGSPEQKQWRDNMFTDIETTLRDIALGAASLDDSFREVKTIEGK